MSFDLSQSTMLASLAVVLFVIVNPIKTKSIYRVFFLLGFFIFLVISIAHLAADFFTNRGIDESVVFHLIYGIKGAGFGEYSALITLVVSSLLFSMVLVFTIHKAGNHGIRDSWLLYPSLVLLILSLGTHPVSTFLSHHTVELSFSEKFEDYYHDPVISTEQVGNRKNLVFIYAEGLERTWLHGELFPGITPNLSSLAESALDYSNINQMPYTGWTMGGIVASQCGIPLVIPSHGNSMSGTNLFLPGATCMGDLLKARGYNTVFYGGADLDFAGKGNFFNTHGFDSVNGKKELINQAGQPDLSGWGLYDNDLLDLTYDKFEALSDSGDPFALFLLTLDTHHPNGLPSKICKNLNSDLFTALSSMHEAVSCSDYLVSRFINRIRQSPHSRQTLIVLISDHLMQKNPATPTLDSIDRKELFMILPGWEDNPEQIDFEGSIFDVGATTLAYLEIDTSIGFGRNLVNQKTIFSGIQYTQNLFRFWSEEFYEFWEFPSLNHGIISMPSKGTLKIGRHSIKTPVLIKFDKNLDTQLLFDFNVDYESQKLDAAYRKLEIDTPFAYITDCGKFKNTKHIQVAHDICLLVGKKGAGNNKLIHLSDSLRLERQIFVNVIDTPGLLGY